MAEQDSKCVIVLDDALPAGMLANTAAILGITLGKLVPELIGDDVLDASGQTHPGITTLPVPVLRGSREAFHIMREKLRKKVAKLTGNMALLK